MSDTIDTTRDGILMVTETAMTHALRSVSILIELQLIRVRTDKISPVFSSDEDQMFLESRIRELTELKRVVRNELNNYE